MDNELQDKLNLLKISYIKKLESTIPEFKIILEKFVDSINLNIEELHLKVHTISGTSGMYGLSELSDISTEFEMYLNGIKNNIAKVNKAELKEKFVQYIKAIEQFILGE